MKPRLAPSYAARHAVGLALAFAEDSDDLADAILEQYELSGRELELVTNLAALVSFGRNYDEEFQRVALRARALEGDQVNSGDRFRDGAAHEAGHGVAAKALGGTEIVLRVKPGSCDYTPTGRSATFRNQLVILIAGHVAELVAAGQD